MRGEQGVEGRGVRARDVVWWGGVLLPMAALLVLMWLYGLDAPYQDSWEFVPVLERSLEGGLGFEALWAQHNVHRIFVPRLIMLGLARCSGWNVRWELGVSLLCAAGTFAGLVWAWRRSMREVPEARGSWMVPFMALMAFSLVQWRIWIWGWLLQISLCQAAVVWALVLLSGQALGWKRVLGAGVFGCVATHSFAAGLMVWPVGFLVGLMCGEAGGRKQWFGLVWGLFSLVGLGSFSAGYALQEGAGGMAPACLGAPGYVCAFLGAPVVPFCVPGAMAAGAAGLVVCAVSVVRMARGQVPVWMYSPYAGWALFAVGAGLMTGLGRAGEGLEQALSPRYMAFSVLFWVGLAALLRMWSGAKGGREPGAGAGRRFWRAMHIAGACAVVVCSVLASAWGAYRADEQWDAFQIGREALLSNGTDEEMHWLFPVPSILRERRAVLVRHGLSVFGEGGGEQR